MTLDNSAVQLEVRRIARLLSVEPDHLADLTALPAQDLSTLRDQIASLLFDAGKVSWERAAAVAGAVPAGLAAKLAQAALGPVLAARVTSSVDIERAVGIAARMSPEFMADTAVNIDPRQVVDLVSALPAETIADVGEVLSARGEHLAMADFVAAISTSALRATVEILDDATLLRTAVLLEDAERLTAVVEMLDAARIVRLRKVAAEEGLQAHLDWVADTVDADQRARLEA